MIVDIRPEHASSPNWASLASSGWDRRLSGNHVVVNIPAVNTLLVIDVWGMAGDSPRMRNPFAKPILTRPSQVTGLE